MLFGKNTTSSIFNIPEDDGMLICEAMLADMPSEDIEELCESGDVCQELVNAGIVTERTIVRLDKQAKLSRAFKTAVFTVAREKKDPKYKKLVTCWKAERALEAYLMKKYKAEATKSAKAMIAKANTAKRDTQSGVVAKAVAGAKKKFN